LAYASLLPTLSTLPLHKKERARVSPCTWSVRVFSRAFLAYGAARAENTARRTVGGLQGARASMPTAIGRPRQQQPSKAVPPCTFHTNAF